MTTNAPGKNDTLSKIKVNDWKSVLKITLKKFCKKVTVSNKKLSVFSLIKNNDFTEQYTKLNFRQAKILEKFYGSVVLSSWSAEKQEEENSSLYTPAICSG